ncbi:3-hydroxyacyl-CoA dehydrogenase NAD-binding domain-containing protein [Nitratireductor sp. GISD-1A_MAKvit]|uniref:3-hydroxyacyl-CoA dehydrogenase NAD-binding domain-containing protein n=1 Tax=Nitratireductor sp. GISD-1A_MAKvit TaxID=3234198 RepID=UPI00346673B7
MTDQTNAADEHFSLRRIADGTVTSLIRQTVHWKLTKDRDGIGWLLLDREGESTNTLNDAVMLELESLLEKVESLHLKALVIRSAKPAGFVAGADIRDLMGMTEPQALEERVGRAHEIVDQLAALPFPTIAVVHGHCLGGGFELALACSMRIAVVGAEFGFPEVTLGLHPGMGGTFRLPLLLKPEEAMKMMLTGGSVGADRAKELGLVDVVVVERHVEMAVAQLLKRGIKRRSAPSGLSGLPVFRGTAARRLRSMLAGRSNEKHHPAPFRLVDLWERQSGRKRALMQREEIRSFVKLATGENAQNLMHVFGLRETLKARASGESGIEHVHVIGAGEMGGDIAAWCAAHGLRVTVTDLDQDVLATIAPRAEKLFDSLTVTDMAKRDAHDRLIPDFAGEGVAQADLVIEAVTEKADIKRKLLKSIAPQMKKKALLATNTSSVPLDVLAGAVPFPERFIGLHFFHPLPRIELIEVVTNAKTSRQSKERAAAFCGSINRLPAMVKSSPGFLVNRVLAPYFAEAFLMLDEGMRKETVDAAAETFGMPIGPIELADRIGLDVCLEISLTLKSGLEEPPPKAPNWLWEMVEDGCTGQKAGRGLYEYDQNGTPRKSRKRLTPHPVMTDRLVLPMLNACVACLREGVVADEETLEGALVFATGFAPFRGGPLRYARARGIAEIMVVMERMQEKYGERFAPNPYWVKLPARQVPSGT